jgi:LPS sulfotransferase NodH
VLKIEDRVTSTYSYHFDEVHKAVPIDGRLSESCKGIKFIFLCFTNRCGSNFLAQTLASDGRLNLAGECWNADEIIRVVKVQSLQSFQSYFSGISHHNMRNGYFISKLGVEHLTLLQLTGVLDQISDRCQFVFIERGDKLAQAISLAIAEETSSWASYNEPSTLIHDPTFSRERIDKNIDMITDQNMMMEIFFARNGISPVRIIYEQLIQLSDVLVNYMRHQLSLPDVRIVSSRILTKRQSGKLNQHWKELYLSKQDQ